MMQLKTSAEQRAEVAAARTNLEEVRAAYLANQLPRDVFQDADWQCHVLERELERVEAREAAVAAEAAAKVHAESERLARIADAQEREIALAPWRKMMNDAAAEYASKRDSAFDRADARAIVEGRLAIERMRERSLVLHGEHEKLNLLRGRVGELPQGDVPPNIDILIQEFARGVDHVISAGSLLEANASGVDRSLVDLATELLVECGGPDRRLRPPSEADADAVAALASAKRMLIDLERDAERVRVQWFDATIGHQRDRLQDNLATAHHSAESARQEVEAQSLALRARGVDAGLVAPAPPTAPPAPEVAATPRPLEVLIDFRDGLAAMFRRTTAHD